MPYDPNFTGAFVPLPKLNPQQRKDLVCQHDGPDGHLISQPNFTVAVSASRRLAWFSAANVDIGKKRPIRRADLTSYWRIDKGLKKPYIIGNDWYEKSNKGFQRGHLTPADCMEWGDTDEEAIQNANSTFYFSNAAPQVPRLNGEVWGQLEMYIGKEGEKTGNARLNVSTGPVLLNNDPVYIHQIGNQTLHVPRAYWKIVWYINSKQKLSRIGFLMSQDTLLENSGLVEPPILEVETPFADLGPFKTYQVNVAYIESITGLSFAPAQEPYKENVPKELIIRKVDVPVARRTAGLPTASAAQNVSINISL